jgi:hypothetical protein
MSELGMDLDAARVLELYLLTLTRLRFVSTYVYIEIDEDPYDAKGHFITEEYIEQSLDFIEQMMEMGVIDE